MKATETVFKDVIGGTGGNYIRVISVNTIPGEKYIFRYRVSNVFGWSNVYSSEVMILSAATPSTPGPATTEIFGLSVKINWSPPAENFSSITAYYILIKDSKGNLKDDLVSCDG